MSLNLYLMSFYLYLMSFNYYLMEGFYSLFEFDEQLSLSSTFRVVSAA